MAEPDIASIIADMQTNDARIVEEQDNLRIINSEDPETEKQAIAVENHELPTEDSPEGIMAAMQQSDSQQNYNEGTAEADNEPRGFWGHTKNVMESIADLEVVDTKLRVDESGHTDKEYKALIKKHYPQTAKLPPEAFEQVWDQYGLPDKGASPEAWNLFTETGNLPEHEALKTIGSSIAASIPGAVKGLAMGEDPLGALEHMGRTALSYAYDISPPGLMSRFKAYVTNKTYETPLHQWKEETADRMDDHLMSAATIQAEFMDAHSYKPRSPEAQQKLQNFTQTSVMKAVVATDTALMDIATVYNPDGTIDPTASTAVYTGVGMVAPASYLRMITTGAKPIKTGLGVVKKGIANKVEKQFPNYAAKREALRELKKDISLTGASAAYNNKAAKVSANIINEVKYTMGDKVVKHNAQQVLDSVEGNPALKPTLEQVLRNETFKDVKRDIEVKDPKTRAKADQIKQHNETVIKTEIETKYKIALDDKEGTYIMLLEKNASELKEIETNLKVVEDTIAIEYGRNFSGRNADDYSTSMYQTFSELEKAAKEVGGAKFENLRKRGVKIDPLDLEKSIKRMKKNSGIKATGVAPVLDEFLSVIKEAKKSKEAGGKLDIMELHDTLSRLKKVNRRLVNSDNPLADEAIGAISKIIDDIQGDAGILVRQSDDLSMVARDDYIEATRYWREEVVQKYEVDPFYNVGKFDHKTGKIKVAPAEFINGIINEVKRGNLLALEQFNKVFKDSPDAKAQLDEFIIDDFMRKVSNKDGSVNIEMADNLLNGSDLKYSRLLNEIDGVEASIKGRMDIMRKLSINKTKLEGRKKGIESLAINTYISKKGDLGSPEGFFEGLLANPKQLQQTLKDIEGDAVLTSAVKRGVSDTIIRKTEDPNLTRFSEKLGNQLELNKKVLQEILEPEQFKNLMILKTQLEVQGSAGKIGRGASAIEAQQTGTGMFKVAVRGAARYFPAIINMKRMGISRLWLVGDFSSKALLKLDESVAHNVLRKAIFDADATEVAKILTKEGDVTPDDIKKIMRNSSKDGDIPIGVSKEDWELLKRLENQIRASKKAKVPLNDLVKMYTDMDKIAGTIMAAQMTGTVTDKAIDAERKSKALAVGAY